MCISQRYYYVTAPGVNNGANNIRDKRNRPLILKNNIVYNKN